MALLKSLFRKGGLKKSKKKLSSQIAALKRAIDQFGKQATISVKINKDGKPSASSHLLKIDEYNGSGALIIDALMPDSANKFIENNTELLIIFQKKGVTVSFVVSVLEKRIEGGSPLYFTSLPTKIKSTQLRKSYRAPVSKFLRIPVIIYSSGRPSVKGLLDDLSLEGAAVTITSGMTDPFYAGEIIEGLYISPPGEKTIQCQVEVKQFRVKAGTTKILGINFLSIKDNGENSINRLLMDCQRYECEGNG